MAAVVITGCAASGGASSAPGASPQVFVIAASAGLTLSQAPASGLVVKVNDFEGTNETFTWPSRALADMGDLSALHTCLSDFRMQVRLASPGIEQPHFVRSGVMRCIEKSGMAAYINTREQDATEYNVEFAAGNVNENVAPDPGVRLFSSASPFLGARRHIRATVPATTVVVDVKVCADQASAAGVFTTTRVNQSPDSSGWQRGYVHTTIQPMLDRFDGCLRSRGYAVESATN